MLVVADLNHAYSITSLYDPRSYVEYLVSGVLGPAESSARFNHSKRRQCISIDLQGYNHIKNNNTTAE